MKRLIAVILTMVLLLGVCAAAQAEAADISGQYYVYSFSAPGYGDYGFFFHFYEADPVLGAVFYAGLSNNRINFAGLYTVEEAPYHYACYPDREAAAAAEDVRVKTEGDAPYTIHFADWSGKEIDSCGWDGSILYNDCETIIGSGSGPLFYHLTEKAGAFEELFEGETGVPYLDFVSPEDPTCTVSLCHNMTYTDMMNYFIDGSWKMSYDEAGNAVYAFTPFDETEDPVTLTVAPDQMTAVYTDADGETTGLVNVKAGEAKALYAGEGTWHVDAYNADAAIKATLYDDGTCEVSTSIFGNSSVIDSGAYTMNEDHSISFAFENAGEMVAKLDMSVMCVVLNYANTETPLGAVEVSIPIGRVEEEAPAAEILFSFTGTYTTLDIYSDNTYEFNFATMGVKEKGTWSFENYQFTLTQSDGNAIAAQMDEARSLVLEYVAEASEQLKDTFTCERDVWGPALVK